jgi:hypothetical protein
VYALYLIVLFKFDILYALDGLLDLSLSIHLFISGENFQDIYRLLLAIFLGVSVIFRSFSFTDLTDRHILIKIGLFKIKGLVDLKI